MGMKRRHNLKAVSSRPRQPKEQNINDERILNDMCREVEGEKGKNQEIE